MKKTNIKKIVWKKISVTTYSARNSIGNLIGSLVRRRIGKVIHWEWYQGISTPMSHGSLQKIINKQIELEQNGS